MAGASAWGFGRSGDRAVITVSDTGQGIAAELLPHVFDRERPEGVPLPAVEDGPGLGLVLARHIVDLHGGTIRAESAGPGTRRHVLDRAAHAGNQHPRGEPRGRRG